MKNRLLLSLILTISSVVLFSFQLPKNIQKKVDKEIKSVYGLDSFSLESTGFEKNDSLSFKIDISELYAVVSDSEVIGYAFVSKAPSKTDEFDYLVLFDTDFIIKKSKVLVYREDYGMEIGSKRWLQQFIGLDSSKQLDYGNDIVPISGATISAVSLTNAVNDLLKSIETIKTIR